MVGAVLEQIDVEEDVAGRCVRPQRHLFRARARLVAFRDQVTVTRSVIEEDVRCRCIPDVEGDVGGWFDSNVDGALGHIVVGLELGGAPKNPKNLWPEPHTQSKVTDPLETKLKRQVCKGVLTLKKARAAIRNFKNTNG